MKKNYAPNRQSKIIAGWYVDTHHEAGFLSIRNNADIINEVSPCIYTFDEKGYLVGEVKQCIVDVIEFCKKENIKIIPLLSNAFNAEMTNRILNDKQLLLYHIEEIVKVIVNNNYDGIDLDYEGLFNEDRDAFSLFVEKLADRIHSLNGKILTIDLHPKKSSADNFVGCQAQDWQGLVYHVDEMRIMCYDQDHSLSLEKKGAVSEFSWVEEIIKYAITVIPKEKIVMSLPFYGYNWNGDKKEYVLYEEAISLSNKYKTSMYFDERAKVPYFEYYVDGNRHKVWVENAQSLSCKLDLVDKFGIRGVSFWHLGHEDENNWEIIREKLA